ncbi:hypothetical protein M1373_00245 [Candidatus Marsarchaeota archaeon]|nr:hypothetical protein [Candidatus Marsarchaeota archaeon]
MDKNKAFDEPIDRLYSGLAKEFEDSGRNISLFHIASRLGDRNLQKKALEKESQKFADFGFNEEGRLFLRIASDHMQSRSLNDIKISHIELSIINTVSKRLLSDYNDAKAGFDNNSGLKALRHAKRLTSVVHMLMRLDSLYISASTDWPLPFKNAQGDGWYEGRNSVFGINFEYADTLCPRIADLIDGFDFTLLKRIEMKAEDIKGTLEKSKADWFDPGKFDDTIKKLCKNARTDKDYLLDVLSDLSDTGMKNTMHMFENINWPVTKMHCLYKAVENLEKLASNNKYLNTERLLGSMQLMAMWESSDLHSFERLFGISMLPKSVGEQATLDAFGGLMRQ